MHRTCLRAGLSVPGCVLAASLCANSSAAQQSPPPGAVPPANEPPISAAPPPPATAPSAPPPTAAPPGSAPEAAPSAPPPGAQWQPAPGEPPPPPPRYGRLGGDPETPNEPGSWDPWAHPVPGRFSHEGFFLRLNLGPALANVWRPDYKWSGLGLGMGLSVGGSVVENFALHADFNSTLVTNPTQRAFGRKSDFDADIVFESMGLGATYYIMPANIYVSGSIGVGVLVFEDDSGASKDTSAGLTLGGMVGKEWWVGSDWGLGVAAQVIYMRVKDYVDEARMHGLTLNILFSATYN